MQGSRGTRSRSSFVAIAAAIAVVLGAIVIACLCWLAGRTPGWESVGELGSVSADSRAAGVGNEAVSLAPGRERDDAGGLVGGVVVTDRSDGEVSFVPVGSEQDSECRHGLPEVSVGPAGFVYQTPLGDCTERHLTAVSTDGYDWETVADPANRRVVAGNDGFLALDGNGIVDALSGDVIAEVPWEEDFLIGKSAASSDGELVVFPSTSLPGQEWGWAMSPDGEWSPIKAAPEWLEGRVTSEVGIQPRLIQATSGGGFRFISDINSATIAAESDDGVTWRVIDTGIPGNVDWPLVRERYTSPDRTLVEWQSDLEADGAPYCFSTTEQCDIPSRLFLEISAEGVTEVLSDYAAEDRELGAGPYSDVNADGLYTRVVERDEASQIMRMTDRDSGDLRSRFDRDPLDLAFCPDDIGAERVDVFARVHDAGETVELICPDSELVRREAGPAEPDDLRTMDSDVYLFGNSAQFTAERVDDDRLVLYAYPTDEVFGSYDISGFPLNDQQR